MSEASGWSTSYRFEGVTRANAKGLANHDLRAPDVVQGNPEVDRTRTHLNEVLVAGEDGRLRPVAADEDAAETVMARLDALLEAAPKNRRKVKAKGDQPAREVEMPLRKDASVMVECVMQLDPKFTGTGVQVDAEGKPLRDDQGNRVIRTCADMTPEKIAETDRLLDVMIAEAIRQHGLDEQNLLYVTKHWDETSPHVQMAWVPTTADGRVNFTESMSKGRRGAAAKGLYAERHNVMRRRLQAAGYDATMERVDGAKRHLGLKDFKAEQDRREQVAAAEARAVEQMKDAAAKRAELRERYDEAVAELGNQRADIEQREQSMQRLTEAFTAREASLDAREVDLERQGETLDAETARLRGRESRLEEREAEAETKAQRAAERFSQANAAGQKAVAARKTYEAALERVQADLALLAPLVEGWKQRNPHTEQGAKAHRSADQIEALKRRITAEAEEIRGQGPAEYELE